jgi:PAS domain S-box-containing protein
MPFLFWVDIAALCVSTVVMLSLGLIAVGAGIRQERNRCFAFFSLVGGGWSVSALILRFSLWLELSQPAGLASGGAPFWLEMTALLIGLMTNFATRVTVLFLGRRTRWTDMILNIGLALVVLFSVPLFRHQLVSNPRFIANGMVAEDMSVWGGVASAVLVVYLIWSLVLFWKERQRGGALSISASILILLLGIVLGGLLDVSFPIMSGATAISTVLLGTVVIGRQVFNPLRERTHELQREIADKVRAQDAYRTFVDHSLQGLLIIQDARIRFVNQAFAAMSGYSVDELTSMADQEIADLIHADDQENVVAHYRDLISDAHRPDRYRCRGRRKDGSTAWVEIYASRTNYQSLAATQMAIIDITDRIQAEAQRDVTLEALQESEQKHRSIIDSIPLGMHMYDLQSDGRLVFVGSNPAADLILGVDHRKFMGQTIEQAFPALADSEIPETYRRVASTGEPWQAEQIDYQEGEIQGAFEVQAFQTSPGKMVAAFLDISERIRNQEMLQFTQFSIDRAAEAVYWIGSDARILYVNEVACAHLGYSCKDLLSMTMHDIDPAIPAESWSEYWRMIQQQGSTTMETFHQHSDGQAIPIEVTANYLEFGGKAFVCAFARDITGRIKAQYEREQLLIRVQEQARQLEMIVETVPDGFLLLDGEARVVLANPAAQGYLSVLGNVGISDRLEKLGEYALDQLLMPPPNSLWHQVTSDRAPGRVFQAVIRPLGNTTGAEGWVAALREVTREQEIQRRVQRQDRLAAVGQLAAGIAHDFNNTLAVISLYAEIVRRSANLTAEDRERLTTISTQARRAADLTEQILDFSRKTVLKRKTLDLVVFLQEQVGLLERTLEENIRITLNHGPEDVKVNADPSRLQQVLMNLAINARDVMPQGGELTITLDQTRVRPDRRFPIPGIKSGKWVRLRVADTGCGIEPEVLPHVFEPFFTTKPSGQGTGLGLAQVWGIIEQHEGKVFVDSKQGQGTTFTIYLPVQTASQQKRVDSSDTSPVSGDGQLILVVEDDDPIREALVQTLEALNYRTLAAANGRQALTLLESNDHDNPAGSKQRVALVLSDAVMPEMGGRALFREIKKRELNVKMVMLTGHPLDRGSADLEAEGISACLLKPPSLDTLASVISDTLSVEVEDPAGQQESRSPRHGPPNEVGVNYADPMERQGGLPAVQNTPIDQDDTAGFGELPQSPAGRISTGK